VAERIDAPPDALRDIQIAGYPYFMRDKVGLTSNPRGMVGFSTRGRNMGDA
jgi:hypothetical protein